MTTPTAAPSTPAERSIRLHQLERALRRRDTSKSIDIIQHTLKQDLSAYAAITDMCDRFDTRGEIRLLCHKLYYKAAVTPFDKAVGAINVARIHRDQARASFSATRVLKRGPFAILKVRHEEDKAIRWFERAQRTGLSGDDQTLVELLMHRSTRCFVSRELAIKDYMEALRVTAYALERGRFYRGHLVAFQRRLNHPEPNAFIQSRIRPLVKKYQPAPDALPYERSWQLNALARARTLLKV